MSDKLNFKASSVIRDKEGYFIDKKNSIYQEENKKDIQEYAVF